MPYQLPHGDVYPPELLRRKAQEAAHHRQHLREHTRSGALTFPELLALIAKDRILARTRVKTALAWLPSIGKVKVQRILADTQTTPEVRLGALTPEQRDKLTQHPRIHQCTAAVLHRRRTGGAA